MLKKDLFNVKDKRILITGASKGLGNICAQALASQGASLVLMARSEVLLKKLRSACKDPDKHLDIAVDLTDQEKLKNAIAKAIDFFGDIDVVLHVAGGGMGLREPLLTSSDFMKLFTLNVTVASEINRLIIPYMIKRNKGNLVHVGSIASIEATGSVGYNSCKAALAAYVRTLGREMASSGIIVTGILPGGFYAPMNSWRRLEANKPDVVKKFVEENLPRKFLGQAEEIIPMIILLCSDSASMMSGCLVPIDAGEGKAYLNT